MNLIINPEFQSLLLPDKDYYTKLERSILSNGIKHPIKVWNKTIIDGHLRYLICKEHNIKFKTQQLRFKSHDYAFDAFLYHQLSKREIPDYYKDELIGYLYKNEVKRPHDHIDKSNYITGEVASEMLAPKFNVKTAHIRRSAWLSTAISILRERYDNQFRIDVLTKKIKVSKKSLYDLGVYNDLKTELVGNKLIIEKPVKQSKFSKNNKDKDNFDKKLAAYVAKLRNAKPVTITPETEMISYFTKVLIDSKVIMPNPDTNLLYILKKIQDYINELEEKRLCVI